MYIHPHSLSKTVYSIYNLYKYRRIMYIMSMRAVVDIVPWHRGQCAKMRVSILAGDIGIVEYRYRENGRTIMYSPVQKAVIVFVNTLLEWCKMKENTLAYKLAYGKVIRARHNVDIAKKKWARYIRFIDSLEKRYDRRTG